MGYDMYLENVPDEMQEEKNKVEEFWNDYANNKNRDIPHDPTYFRLNIFGMGAYCRYMEQLGMLATHYQEPEWDESIIESPMAGEEPGIPITKLGSNDGWLVLPEECASALQIYDKHPRAKVEALLGDGIEYWDKWINFIRLASANGGFRVH